MKKIPFSIKFAIILLLFACMTIPASAAAPKQFFIDFKDAYLVYAPSSGTKQVVADGSVLSYGGDWQVSKLKPYLYHMRLKTWQGFYWKVNTSRKEVYQVTGGTFGQLGGSEKTKNFTVDVVGGGGEGTPDRFMIKFSDSYLVYVTASGTLQIAAGGNVLSYGSDWKVSKVKDNVYHFMLKTWKGFFWKVNTKNKKAFRIRDGAFGKKKEGGTKEKLNATVRVVKN